MDGISPLDGILVDLRQHGETDEGYLAHHFPRFRETKREFCATWDRARGLRLLDVGAHWLHQSYLWAKDGYLVTAVDLPLTFDLPAIKRLAEAHAIRLVPCADLESASALDVIESDSIDVMLFTEIIEHITFNPVKFWKQIYRILAPGARIVITTPNYYAMRARTWHWRRFLTGFGAGLSVDEILDTPTYGHHWREFSMRELVRYFCLLSSDFNTVKQRYPTSYGFGTERGGGHWLERNVSWLRPNLHLEIELTQKQAGITRSPQW